ncbi:MULTISPECIES: hypothetical protein [Vibrio]|nr:MULTISPECIES: hypothetical protein [Vibrio]
MQNNYIKALAVKTYQEEPQKEPYRNTKRTFHSPSFIAGILVSVLIAGVL